MNNRQGDTAERRKHIHTRKKGNTIAASMNESRKKTVQGLFKGGSIVFVGLVIELVISFFGKILMARILGQVDYGVATIGLKVLSFSSAILLLGLNNGVGRYIPRFERSGERKGVILSALELVVPTTVVVAAVLAVFADEIATTLLRTPEAGPVLLAAAVGIPFATLLKLSIGVIQGMEETVPKVLIRNLFQPVFRFGLIAVVLIVGLGSYGIVWAYTASFAVAGFAGVYYIVKYTPAAEKVPGDRIRFELLTFSAPLMLMTSMMMILSNVDVFFLSYFHPSGEIGVYNVIYPLAELLTMTLSGFSFIFLPIFSRLHGDGKQGEMVRIYQLVTKWVFLITLPALFFFILFPETVIGASFGREYTEGASALAILAIGFSIQSVVGPNVQSLTSVGATRIIMLVNLIAAGTNIVLNLLLIPQYSYFGAAIATSVSYTLLNVLYSVALYRRTGIHPFSRQLLRPAMGSMIPMGIVSAAVWAGLPRNIVVVAISFIVFMILYTVVVLRLDAVQEEEIMLLLSIEERFDMDLSRVKSLARRISGEP